MKIYKKILIISILAIFATTTSAQNQDYNSIEELALSYRNIKYCTNSDAKHAEQNTIDLWNNCSYEKKKKKAFTYKYFFEIIQKTTSFEYKEACILINIIDNEKTDKKLEDYYTSWVKSYLSDKNYNNDDINKSFFEYISNTNFNFEKNTFFENSILIKFVCFNFSLNDLAKLNYVILKTLAKKENNKNFLTFINMISVDYNFSEMSKYELWFSYIYLINNHETIPNSKDIDMQNTNIDIQKVLDIPFKTSLQTSNITIRELAMSKNSETMFSYIEIIEDLNKNMEFNVHKKRLGEWIFFILLILLFISLSIFLGIKNKNK